MKKYRVYITFNYNKNTKRSRVYEVDLWANSKKEAIIIIKKREIIKGDRIIGVEEIV